MNAAAPQPQTDDAALALRIGRRHERAFETMMRAHNRMLFRIARSILKDDSEVTPEDSPTSQSLKAGGEENVKKLQGLKGKEFDKAYIDHEVAYHQAVLDAVDKTLIPNAKNKELKALIIKVRPAFVAHLDHAKMIQAKLGA